MNALIMVVLPVLLEEVFKMVSKCFQSFVISVDTVQPIKYVECILGECFYM
jgi:hypothetical protein